MTAFTAPILVALFALAGRASAGNVLVVDPTNGPYTQIQAAVNAAVDGDVILVRSGTYSSVTLVDRELDLVADGGATVQGRVTVQGLASTRRVTLSGLTVLDTGLYGGALFLSNCSGSVRVQDCVLRGNDGGFSCFMISGSGGIHVETCQDVTFARCTATGGRGTDGTAGNPWPGLHSLGSRLAAYDCTFVGGRGGTFSQACSGYSYGMAGSSGGLPYGGEFFSARCTFQGGQGGSNVSATWPAGWGGPGLFSWHNTSRLLEITAVGGAPGSVGYGGVPGPPIAQQGGAVDTLPGQGRSLAGTSLVRDNGTLTLTFAGTPGDHVELVWAERTRFHYSAALRGVSLTARRPLPPVLQAGTIGGTGMLVLSGPVGDLGPGIQGGRWFLQAAFTDTNGVTTLSGPHTLIVVDQAF